MDQDRVLIGLTLLLLGLSGMLLLSIQRVTDQRVTLLSARVGVLERDIYLARFAAAAKQAVERSQA